MATHIGQRAEKAVADYLASKHYKIIAMNWKTARCEIDIVASKSNTVYFIEVKYRRSDSHGSGFSYITDAKLSQMHYAAHSWASYNNWNGQMLLAAAEVSGESFDQITFVEI